MPPNFAKQNVSVDVQVQFFLQSFDAVDEQHESVALTGFLRTWWTDSRLAFAQDPGKACVQALTVPDDMLWGPKIYIYNAIKLTYEKNGALTTVHANGTVFHSVAIHGSLKCAMQFHRMPYDSHGCFLKLGCYSETTRSIQIRPRYGSVHDYMKQTGLGVVGDKMFSPTWFIEGEQLIRSPGIRTAHFWPDLGGDTDIVFLPFQFSRRPGYLVRMVLVPSWLFLVVSYTGFFIDPASAPARAAVALLPVLIMRSLQGFVFSKLPQVATCVWLIDYLLGSMILCCYAAVHLAVVQLLLGLEGRAAENLKRLQNVEDTARKLIDKSNKDKKFVATLLSEYTPTPHLGTLVSYLARKREDRAPESETQGRRRAFSEVAEEAAAIGKKDKAGEDAAQSLLRSESPTRTLESVSMPEQVDEHFALHVQRNSAHSPIAQNATTEGDLEVIRYLLSLWTDEVPEPTATPEMLRRVMTRFGIYMTVPDAAKIMCMFLRDKGFDTLDDISRVRIIFSLFMELMLDIEKYRVAVRPLRWYQVPLSQGVPWSMRLDVGMRMLFPFCVALHAAISIALIDIYPENPEVGLVADLRSVMQWQ